MSPSASWPLTRRCREPPPLRGGGLKPTLRAQPHSTFPATEGRRSPVWDHGHLCSSRAFTYRILFDQPRQVPGYRPAILSTGHLIAPIPLTFVSSWPERRQFAAVLGTTGMKNIRVTVCANEQWLEILKEPPARWSVRSWLRGRR